MNFIVRKKDIHTLYPHTPTNPKRLFRSNYIRLSVFGFNHHAYCCCHWIGGAIASGPIRFLATYLCVCMWCWWCPIYSIYLYFYSTSNLTSNIDIHHYMAYYFAIVVSTEVNIMAKVYSGFISVYCFCGHIYISTRYIGLCCCRLSCCHCYC